MSQKDSLLIRPKEFPSSQGLQRQTTPLGWYELDFVATQQERLGVVGLVKVHHVQLVQLTVGQVQVLHGGGQAAEGFTGKLVVVGHKTSDGPLPEGVAALLHLRPKLVVAEIHHLQPLEVPGERQTCP